MACPPRIPTGKCGSRIVFVNQEEEIMPLKEFAGIYYEEALDEKTRQLVAMAAMAAAGCNS